MLRTLFMTAAVCLTAVPALAEDYEHCKLLPGSTSAVFNYEQVGPAACEQLCRDTEGCIAWSYTPHNFNPKSAPGECRTLADVSDDEGSDKDYCGFLDPDANI
ncbi:PAN domain-containing protein [Mameliella sp. CS4]|uniref:PAN domain-containing protein n=1 Tax=Mameliella sp. CS4 TaxID=2862329 RepID=UPI001C5E7146|nr:PAN domain-containing protein [Mameliella sp. CS4]MBW4983130.1 PAN domain-containing protein [Mameliella sp. CS4]